PPYVPFYGATWGGASWSSFINANNFTGGCYSAQNNNPALCSDVTGQLILDPMNPHFWSNLPGAPADPYAIARYEFNMNNAIYGGGAGTAGSTADSYSVFYGDINTSSVTIYAGAGFL